MFKGYHLSYIEISQKEFDKHLKNTQFMYTLYGSYNEYAKSNIKINTHCIRWITVNNINITLTYKLGSKWFNFRTNITKNYPKNFVQKPFDPIAAYSTFSRVVKPLEIPRHDVENIGPYVNHHLDRKGTYEYAICYDVNKAYFNTFTKPMPLDIIGYNRKPKKDEVGFNTAGIPVIGPSNLFCEFIFRLGQHKGLCKYSEIMLKHMNDAPDKKPYFKFCINASVGNLANHNPFLRNMIVWYNNTFIKSKVDKNTIWSNTDSIVSTVKRPDLEIGDKIGQFKVEHEGRFIQAGTGYQWLDDNIVTNSGISRDKIKIFEQVYNRQFILGQDNDKLYNLTIWRFNYETQRLEKIR